MLKLKALLKGIQLPTQPRHPHVNVWMFWAAVREAAKWHYAHNRVAKPIRY